jgi:TonB family protein
MVPFMAVSPISEPCGSCQAFYVAQEKHGRERKTRVWEICAQPETFARRSAHATILIVALVVGVVLGTAGTLLAKHDFRHRRQGWLRISERTEPLSRIHVDGVIQDQKAIRKVLPVYPDEAVTAQISGTVLFHVVIAKDGTVESADYLSGPSVFPTSAASAVKQWRYKPTIVDGEPVEVDTIVPIVFAPH